MQTGVWQGEVIAGQSPTPTQPTQAPAPSQISAAPHDVPCASFWCDGVEPEHRSWVQAFPSMGGSLASATTSGFPLPSHWLVLQSPEICSASATPRATLVRPHWWLVLQVREWHSVSVPGQVAGLRQPTQAPWPSQTEVPPQLVP